MTADHAALLQLATELAVEAGNMARDGRDQRGVAASATKSSATDMVTEFDKASEALIVGGILRARPDDAIVGEEGTDTPGTSGVDWLIDPIDGPSATRARALVDHFGSLHGFVTARRSELVSAGLSRAAARHVIGCRRLAGVLVRKRRALRVRDARTAARMVPHLAWHPVEEVWVILLDATQRALACTLVARGN